ncbi:Uncharacterised protein [Chlamydia abortus]|uniref:QueT transporter family protein n=1 Tax=Paenibacillus residui TaxID=629724 RepID=A0ABW3DI17_9BACL|nr:QueT transporter family protein [Paenibacillus sp. 32O-W]SHE14320.1 Uncharacterised protein [Chlamydia abortus]
MFAAIFRRKWTTVDYVLVVVLAALYAVALMTLANIKLIPSVPVRPANALQPVFGMLFGLPGCLGLAFGNLINDLIIGDPLPHKLIVGFIINFLGGFLGLLFVSHPLLKTIRSVVEYYFFVVILASGIIAGSIWVNVLLGFTPVEIATAFTPIVFANQAIATGVLGPVLLRLLHPFVKRAGLYRGLPIRTSGSTVNNQGVNNA